MYKKVAALSTKNYDRNNVMCYKFCASHILFFENTTKQSLVHVKEQLYCVYFVIDNL